MLVMKFGGTSMGSAGRMSNSVDIMCDRARADRICVVVSAVAGISNLLQESITAAMRLFDGETTTSFTTLDDFVATVRNKHSGILADLREQHRGYPVEGVSALLEPFYALYGRLLVAVASFGECPPTIESRIMGLGEQMCIPIVSGILEAKGLDHEILDSRKIIITDGGPLTEADPVLSRIEENCAQWRTGGKAVLLAPGFVSSDISGKPGLLGRNGSDFSAALYAMGLHADKLEVWTDVDGIYTADPRIVRDARLVDDLSYEEAMELSFFGSKVLHPKTIAPAAVRGIEIWSMNSFNPAARGSRITSANRIPQCEGAGPVRGVTCLKDTAMISISGAGMKGRKGIAARIFAAVSRAGISVLLITQSSSEYAISFCVRGSEAKSAVSTLEEEFALEIREKLIDDISLLSGMAIVSIVGDGMMQCKGVAGTFFSALAFGGINIQAIAQGSSERSISTVVESADGDKAVKIAHRFFFNTMQTVEVFLYGIGVVGGKLLEQIRGQQRELRKHHIDMQVWLIANSRNMLINRDGIDLESWRAQLESSSEAASLDQLINLVKTEKPLNPVFVDCTATSAIPERYPDLFRAGMHVVTPNKRANSLSWEWYTSLRAEAVKNRKRFLYETNVGAGLPVLDTFRNMLKSGDELYSFSGIMSGSLSYIFGRLDEGVPFSQAVQEARQKGFTEPDPRDDLSGLDVARKALIIAREAHCPLELDHITLSPLFPDSFDTGGTVEEFMKRLPDIDGWFSDRLSRLRAQGKVLRFAASIDGKDCSAGVGPIEVSASDPLAAIRGGENAFVFTTKYYSPIPLVIRGYGAGADVTASGVFADILRTITW